MIEVLRSTRMLSMFLSVALIIATFGSVSVSAQRRYGHYYGGTHHSRTKGALIGGAVGGIGGALIGGRKGALLGAGVGAGSGYLIQRHRNHRRHRHYHRRYYRGY